jgi:serine/threonine-protein kinase HipA
VNPEPLGDGDVHQLALIGDREVTPDSLMANDALNLFGVRPPVAQTFRERLQPALHALPRYAAAHGADALTIDLMSSRIDAAVAAVS